MVLFVDSMLVKERAGVFNAFSMCILYGHAVAVVILLQNHSQCTTEHDDNK